MIRPALKHLRPAEGETPTQLFERFQAAVDEALLDLAKQIEAEIVAAIPTGARLDWQQDTTGVWSHTPNLPTDGSWVKADGKLLRDGASPFDSQTIPSVANQIVRVKPRGPR